MGRYAKAIVAALGAGLTAAAGIIGADTTWGKAIAVALAVVSTLAVYAVPNTPTAPSAPGPAAQ